MVGPVAKVNNVCRLVLALAEEDIQAAEEMARRQASTLEPFRLGQQADARRLGKGNQDVIHALVTLRRALLVNAPDAKA